MMSKDIFSKIRALNLVDKGYIAGIIDADGWIAVYTSRNGGKLHKAHILGVTNTSKSLIDWLHEKLPANRSTRMPPSSLSKKVQHDWRVHKLLDIKFILEVIKPYMIVKAKQAEAMLDYIYGKMTAEEVDKELKRLKHE